MSVATRPHPEAGETGSTLLLTIFYCFLGLSIVLVVVSATTLYLERKRLFTVADGAANTPLGLMHGVDFDIETHEMVYDEPWRGRLARGEITAAQASDAARQFLNVVLEHRFVLVARKAAR